MRGAGIASVKINNCIINTEIQSRVLFSTPGSICPETRDPLAGRGPAPGPSLLPVASGGNSYEQLAGHCARLLAPPVSFLFGSLQDREAAPLSVALATFVGAGGFTLKVGSV